MTSRIVGTSPFIAMTLIGAFAVVSCSSSSLSERPKLQSATEIRVIKYDSAEGTRGQRITSVRGKAGVAKVMQLLGSEQYPFPTQSKVEYKLEFRSSKGDALGTVIVLGRNAEWYEQQEVDRLYAVTPELMEYLDGLFN